jgi:hypothetical protein
VLPAATTTSLSISVPTITSFDEPVAGNDRDEDADETDESEQPTTDAVAPVDPDVALVFDRPGVHPVSFELSLNGRTLAETTTFVRVLDPDGTIGEMSIGLMMGQTREPTVALDGTVSLSTTDINELELLADTLAGIDTVAAALGQPDAIMPRGVFIEPATLQALTASEPELAARLTAALMRSNIVAAPRLPFEPSAAAAADQTATYTKMLSDGEDLLRQLLPRTDVGRNVYAIREPFTTAAAELLRQDVGSRLMVMGFDLYERTEGGNGPLTDTSQLVTIALSNDSAVKTAVIDPHIATRIEEGADDPMRTAVQIVADLLVTAQSIADDGGIVSRHGLILARSDLGVPDAALTSDLVELLATTEGLRLVEPESLELTVDNLLRPGGGGEVAVTLPNQPFVDLGNRIELINEVSEEIFAFASMLPPDAPEIDEWLRVLDALPTTAINDSDATEMVEGLRDDFDVYEHSIEGPEPFTFTLTGRRNTLSFSLTNTSSTPLKVRVRLSSPKLTFPDGDQVVTLPPGDTELDVAAEALSNGKSSVFLRVYTPAENSDIQLMPEVVLTARVSSLAGLGQLLTGAFLLLLFTWWARHWQQTRRKRNAADHVGRHPAGNGGSTDQATGESTGPSPGDEASPDVHDLAPDAAASSLPPS